MIDKLHLRTIQEINFEEAKARLLIDAPIVQWQMDCNYHHCYVFRKEDGSHLITIKFQPKIFTIRATSIELNPSRFKSFKNVAALLNDIIDLEFLEIKRIDYCVDISIPLEEIRRTLKVKHKSKRSDHEVDDELTGFDIGRGNEVFCIYDKATERIRARVYKLIPGETKRVQTRIEVRHQKSKINNRQFTGLPEFINQNPFKSLQFFEGKAKEEIEEKYHAKLEALNALIGEDGLHSLFKQLNKHNNFNRNRMKLLKETDTASLILKTYRDNLGHLFKETE